MTIEEFDTRSPNHLTTVLRRMSAPVGAVRTGVANLAARLPATMRATQSGAYATTGALQALPDETLRWLAATSVGLGAGFYLTGKRRLIVAAGVAPAVIMGVAIALRPSKHATPGDGAA
jgi:hypothetical protein